MGKTKKAGATNDTVGVSGPDIGALIGVWAKQKLQEMPSLAYVLALLALMMGVLWYFFEILWPPPVWVAFSINWIATHIVKSLVALGSLTAMAWGLVVPENRGRVITYALLCCGITGAIWFCVDEFGPVPTKKGHRSVTVAKTKTKIEAKKLEQQGEFALSAVVAGGVTDYLGAGEEEDAPSKIKQQQKSKIEKAYADLMKRGENGAIPLTVLAVAPCGRGGEKRFFYALVANDFHLTPAKGTRWAVCDRYSKSITGIKVKKRLDADVEKGKKICEELGVEL